MAELTVNHVISGTLTVDTNLKGTIAGQGGTPPVLETLTVRPNPAQSQTLTPETGVDGWNSVTVPQSMACVLQTDFLLGMGGDAYETIASKDYISIYDTSGRNVTRFYKSSPATGTSMSEVCFATAGSPIVATVQAHTGGNGIFYGIKGVEGFIIKGATNTYSSCCKGWNTLKTLDIESPEIGISSFEDNPIETLILRGTTSIGKQAFYYSLTTLQNIYIYSSTVCSLGRNAFNPNITATVHVPADLLASYQADTNWTAYTHLSWVAITE